MSDRIEELIAAGEVEFHPRKGGEFKLPSIKGRSQMFKLAENPYPRYSVTNCIYGEDVRHLAFNEGRQAQRQQTAWEAVRWLEKHYPRAAIALAGELMSEHIDSPKVVII